MMMQKLHIWENPGLANAFGGCEQLMQQKFKDGIAELWKTQYGYLLTECLPEQSELFVWCFQGHSAVRLVVALAPVAAMCGFTHIGWFTHHKQAIRGFRRFKPEITLTGIPGEMRFRVSVEELQNDSSSTVGRTSDEEPVESSRRSEPAKDCGQRTL